MTLTDATTKAVAELQEAAAAAVQRATVLQLVPPEAQLLTEDEVCALCAVKRDTLYSWRLPRFQPDPPKFATDKLGRKARRSGLVRYRLADVLVYIEAHMRDESGKLILQRAMRRKPSTMNQQPLPDA